MQKKSLFEQMVEDFEKANSNSFSSQNRSEFGNPSGSSAMPMDIDSENENSCFQPQKIAPPDNMNQNYPPIYQTQPSASLIQELPENSKSIRWLKQDGPEFMFSPFPEAVSKAIELAFLSNPHSKNSIVGEYFIDFVDKMASSKVSNTLSRILRCDFGELFGISSSSFKFSSSRFKSSSSVNNSFDSSSSSVRKSSPRNDNQKFNKNKEIVWEIKIDKGDKKEWEAFACDIAAKLEDGYKKKSKVQYVSRKNTYFVDFAQTNKNGNYKQIRLDDQTKKRSVRRREE